MPWRGLKRCTWSYNITSAWFWLIHSIWPGYKPQLSRFWNPALHAWRYHGGYCLRVCVGRYDLTHWGLVTHICVTKLTIIGSDNGLSPGRRQAIIWTNAGILLIWPLETNFSEILIEFNTFSSKKMHMKMSSGKRRPFVSASVFYDTDVRAISNGVAEGV